MAASQRPGFTGRSQTPPASKPLVRKIFFERLFLFLETDSCLCTGCVEDIVFDKCFPLIPVSIVAVSTYCSYGLLNFDSNSQNPLALCNFVLPRNIIISRK